MCENKSNCLLSPLAGWLAGCYSHANAGLVVRHLCANKLNLINFISFYLLLNSLFRMEWIAFHDPNTNGPGQYQFWLVAVVWWLNHTHTRGILNEWMSIRNYAPEWETNCSAETNANWTIWWIFHIRWQKYALSSHRIRPMMHDRLRTCVQTKQ